MLCNFVVEISVGGLAWCLKQTQKNFFFKKNKGQECVCYQKNFGCLSIFTTRATAFFSKTMVYLSERKHPKLRPPLMQILLPMPQMNTLVFFGGGTK